MSTIWIGELKGELLVYDPAIQLPDCPHLFLWKPADGEMGKYIADIIRKRIKPHGNPSLAAAHIKSYQDWYRSSGAAWLAEERQYYALRKQREAAQEQERLEHERCKAEAERIANLAPAERHKERLERLGKEYHGVRPATENPLRRRIARCYDCKDPLDNSIDIECVSCGWILCSCGACGCGYVGYA